MKKIMKRTKKIVVGGIIGLSLLGLIDKAGSEGIDLDLGIDYAPTALEERTITDKDPSVPFELKTENKYETNTLSLKGGLGLNFTENYSVRLDNCLKIINGSIDRKFGWTKGGANGSYSDQQNNLKLVVGKRFDAGNWKVFISAGYAAVNEAESEKINEIFEDYGLELKDTQRSWNTEYSGPLAGFKVGLDVNNWLLEGTLEYTSLNGKRAFEANSELGNTKRGYNLSGSCVQGSLAARLFPHDELIEEIGGKLGLGQRSYSIKQESTNEASPIYEDYKENRTDLELSFLMRLKIGLELKLGLGQKSIDSEGTLTEKTKSNPNIFIGVGYRGRFSI